MVDSSGTYGFLYDNMNRLTEADTTYAFVSLGKKSVKYGYDAGSNRKTMTDPQSLVTTYGYDTLNRLGTLGFNGQNPGFTFGYDALSRRTLLTRPNGINTSYSYDPASSLTSVLHQLGSTTLDGASYTYDAAENRKTRTDQRLGTTVNYGYDNIYQLTGVTQGASTNESYTYDLVGNRLSSLNVTQYNYNASNELTSTPTLTYSYDSAGNLKSKSDGTTYNWDYENRLTSVVLPNSGGTVSFKYDAFGRRAQKSFVQGSTTTTTNYLYDGANLMEEVDNSGNVLARYTQGREIDESLAMLRSGTTSYYQQDGTDSVTSLSNGAGALANTYTFDSFGQVTAHTGTLVNPFQYTGREFDPETGIEYYRERYFDPSSGRFLSEDPLRFKTATNFYPYAANNPLRFNDPMGLSAADVQRIFGACQKCTDQLTKSGERRAGSGTMNGWANNIIDFFTLGYHYSGCTRQADLTASCMNLPSSPYDSPWNFTVESTEWGFHHVTMGRSKDPSDPIVVCDPWRNTHYTIPSGPGPGSGGGNGGGGGTSF